MFDAGAALGWRAGVSPACAFVEGDRGGVGGVDGEPEVCDRIAAGDIFGQSLQERCAVAFALVLATDQKAAQAVAAVTYPPEGIRGVSGITRATRFGTTPGYHAKARDEVCLIVQVETVAALDQIEAIAAVPGIDGIFVGPADLAASLGYPGLPNHDAVTKVVLEATRRITAAGKPAGILTLSPEDADRAIDAGAVFVARDLDIAALRKGLSS